MIFFNLTGIQVLPLTFSANGLQFSIEGQPLSQSVPNMGMQTPHSHPQTHTLDPGLLHQGLLSSWPSDTSGVSV